MTRWKFPAIPAALIAVVGGMLACGAARAVPVTVTLTGHLTSVPTALGAAFSVGQAFTWSYSYNTATGNAGGPTTGIYYYQGSHLDIGGGAFTVDAPAGAVFANSVQIVNLASFDAYKVDATDNLVYSPTANLGPYLLSQVFTQFTYAASQFPSVALPPGAPPFTSANGFSMQFRLDPGSLDGRLFVNGVIDSVSDTVQVAVPAPGALAPVVAALLFAGVAARRRRVR